MSGTTYDLPSLVGLYAELNDHLDGIVADLVSCRLGVTAAETDPEYATYLRLKEKFRDM